MAIIIGNINTLILVKFLKDDYPSDPFGCRGQIMVAPSKKLIYIYILIYSLVFEAQAKDRNEKMQL